MHRMSGSRQWYPGEPVYGIDALSPGSLLAFGSGREACPLNEGPVPCVATREHHGLSHSSIKATYQASWLGFQE